VVKCLKSSAEHQRAELQREEPGLPVRIRGEHGELPLRGEKTNLTAD